MMKKLLTVITLIVLSASLMASAPIDLTMNVGPVTKTKTEAMIKEPWKTLIQIGIAVLTALTTTVSANASGFTDQLVAMI